MFIINVIRYFNDLKARLIELQQSLLFTTTISEEYLIPRLLLARRIDIVYTGLEADEVT